MQQMNLFLVYIYLFSYLFKYFTFVTDVDFIRRLTFYQDVQLSFSILWSDNLDQSQKETWILYFITAVEVENHRLETV